jgi:molybdate transport system ATP-binding protein
MANLLLEVKNLHAGYGRAEVLTGLNFQMAAGQVVTVIGPNGAGKSTLVRALAGIVPLDGGHVTCDGATWDGDRVRLETRRRDLGMVFQQDLLFPHLSALGNVAFGPRSRGVERRDAEASADVWLSRLGVADLAERRPAQLSGGQAQRVAIARALVTGPRLLLLDEPLSSLDVGVAMALRIELSRHLADFDGVVLLVTHDALDAMTLANRVLVLDEGRVAQEGMPAEVARRPSTDHVARLVGLNVLCGRSRGTRVQLADGATMVTATPYDGAVHLTFPPAAVALSLAEAGSGSPRNQWRGRVVSVAPNGPVVRVQVDALRGLIADVTVESAARLGITPGTEVWSSVKATEVVVHGESERIRPPSAPLA